MFSKIRMVLFRSLLESLGNVGASEEPIPSRRAHFLRSNLMDMVEELKSVENEKGFILVASVPASEVNSALENLQREVNNFVKINNSFDSCHLIKFINKYEWCKHIYHRDFLFYGDQCVRSPHGEFLFYGNNAYGRVMKSSYYGNWSRTFTRNVKDEKKFFTYLAFLLRIHTIIVNSHFWFRWILFIEN